MRSNQKADDARALRTVLTRLICLDGVQYELFRCWCRLKSTGGAGCGCRQKSTSRGVVRRRHVCVETCRQNHSSAF